MDSNLTYDIMMCKGEKCGAKESCKRYLQHLKAKETKKLGWYLLEENEHPDGCRLILKTDSDDR